MSSETESPETARRAAVEALARDVAHDVNNVLNIIGAQASILAARGDDPARREKAIRSIEEAVKRGTALARRLLELPGRDDEPRATPADGDPVRSPGR